MTIKTDFIEFLLKHDALKFGEFKLKSGRVSPYFFNLGVFNSGKSLRLLGRFFAAALLESGFKYDVLFGPAYKGIPLVCTTSIALADEYNKDVPYSFNRKQKKNYGDGGDIVGAELAGNVVMFDDVITAGTTVRETIELLKTYEANFSGIVIAFDRQERGRGELSAIKEVEQQYQIPVKSIICLDDVLDYLDDKERFHEAKLSIQQYQALWGG